MVSIISSLSDRSHYSSLSECIYLNQASLGLIGQPALSAMHDFLDDVARHGNLYMTDSEEVAFFDDLREQAAILLNCPTDQLAIVGSAGEMLSQLPYLFQPEVGTKIVTVASDFPAITRPWIAYAEQNDCSLVFVEDDPGQDVTDSLIQAIDARTAVVAVSYVQFSTGTRCDVGRLRQATRTVGARLIIDATQAAGAIPIDAESWNADVVVCSGYKWLGGHGGVGLAVMSPDFLNKTPPAPGWMGAPDPFDMQATSLPLAPDARRYTQSTMSYVSLKGLSVALSELLALGPKTIEGHARQLSRRLMAYLDGSGWEPFRQAGSCSASDHIIALACQGKDTERLTSALRENNIVCGTRNGRIRISLAHYNDENDIHCLARCLAG